MDEHSKGVITPETQGKFDRLLSELSSEQSILVNRLQIEVLSNVSQYAKIADFGTPVRKVERIVLKAAGHLSAEAQNIVKRALIAKLALHLPALVAKLDLPESILAVYPDALGRLADFLKNSSGEPYDSTGEFFRKDVRFVLGLSVPCGARVVDLISRVPLHSALFSTLRSRDISGLMRYVRAGGAGFWFRNHADSRHLTEYNEPAHEHFYLRVADLLKQHENIRGLAGTSWYYDPRLPKISPRLSYLYDRPRERGAFFLRHGTNESIISNATKTSATRRRLYQEGKYMPVSYSMLWPRNELISWAEQ